MNTSIRRVSLVVMALVVLLLANATLTQVFTAPGLRADPRNQRVLLDEYSRQRGQISASGQLLASSVATDSRFRFLRQYADPLVYAPVTGFYSLNYSSAGLERAEDSVLNGSDPRLFGRRLADFFTGRDPRGGSVVTTIRPDVQQAAYDAMHRGCKDGCRGSVVALEPSTGKILAMVSTPSYDPNLLASQDSAKENAAWKQLQEDPAQPMLNRAISQTYPPGSTFKVITTAAALADGKTVNTEVTASPTIFLPGSNATLENYNRTSCGGGDNTTLKEAFARSCNTAFAKLGSEQLKRDKLVKAAQAFGLDHEIDGIPLQVATSTVGSMSDDAAVAMSSIGQKDVAVTPLQNAMVAAAVANKGVLMQPHLVDSLKGPDLSNLSTTTPDDIGQAVTPAIANTLTELMIASEQRTAQTGAIPSVQIASKTGTAEHGTDPRNTPPHAWYIAFAPASSTTSDPQATVVTPKVAIAVLVEDGGDRALAATGGSVAAPIGRQVIAAALQGAS
ncbi:penicillin-binding protein PbpA [Mycolicibacterium phlei]|uniref:penicillin-binding transpeptidase domain-containing protein n=1 Tax=Mycobacteroides chelonae TaxID=1774 RepID=UPI000618BA8E|nr:penicillin-binding protein 2 [Mycobacteroides chelonae]VEG14101.1 penicillin-binding protein PbpA [Mycolicibacterium phlei]AKC37295.1 penicillin-binding protein [Mycobacteroides chelonae]ANA96310.1 penicillin-binding protein [Mycobacteroides chelonae CCUG 47445]OLT81527.1 penicillin-binding protein [Mycobacteroides chelonae]ORV17561.1 penicillin-binding protein [Mycobacteroides chelonae]